MDLEDGGVFLAHLLQGLVIEGPQLLLGLLPGGVKAGELLLYGNFAAAFADMEDAYMKARATDVRDVSGRVVNILSGAEEQDALGWSTSPTSPALPMLAYTFTSRPSRVTLGFFFSP